jgi:hypothetical protein
MNKSAHRVRPHLLPQYTSTQAATASGNPSPPAAPPTREDPPFQRQSEAAEKDIQDLINSLDFLKRELGEILKARLVTMKLMPNTNDYDFKKLLAILLRGNKGKRQILPQPLSPNQIKKLQLFRNNVDHNNWYAVQTKFKSYLNSMTALTTSLVNPQLAGQIAAAENRIVVHKDFTGGLTFKPFTFPQNGSFDMDAGLGISLITARIFNLFAVPATWKVLNDKLPPGSTPPSMDVYANVGEIIDKVQADPNFLPQGNIRILKSVKATRLNVAHGDHTILLKNFEAKYDDLVGYLRMADHPEDADIVQEVKDKLVEFKNSGEEVTSSSFPMLYSS